MVPTRSTTGPEGFGLRRVEGIPSRGTQIGTKGYIHNGFSFGGRSYGTASKKPIAELEEDNDYLVAPMSY